MEEGKSLIHKLNTYRTYEENNYNDSEELSEYVMNYSQHTMSLKKLEDLIRKDQQREKDNFPKRLKVLRHVYPSPTGKKKVIVVPKVDDGTFHHKPNPPRDGDSKNMTGSGNGNVGDIIGKKKISPEGDENGGDPSDEEAEHALEIDPEDIGRILSEKFQLPNLKQKGKKRSLLKHKYDLTDISKGRGLILDIERTMREIIQTNLALGKIKDVRKIDPKKLVVSQDDLIYRTLSKERDYEAQALVFFVRDYSGSMAIGQRTDMLVHQHILLYCWLQYQYKGRVDTRFVLHDVKATEVPDFNTYYHTSVAGGTKVISAYQYVREEIERKQLQKNYNIYIFQGTDGDDYDTSGNDTVTELRKLLPHVNMFGITITNETRENFLTKTTVENYLELSGLYTEQKLRKSIITKDDENDIIRSMKELLA